MAFAGIEYRTRAVKPLKKPRGPATEYIYKEEKNNDFNNAFYNIKCFHFI